MASVSFCERQFLELVRDIQGAAHSNDPDLMGDYLDSLIAAGRDWQEAVTAQAEHQAEVNARLSMVARRMSLDQLLLAGRLPTLEVSDAPSD